MRIPILLMARELHLGGSERQMTEIAKALDRSSFEPHIGAFRTEGMRSDELRATGIPVVQFPVMSYKSPSFVKPMADIVRYVGRNTIRAVHTWDYPTGVSVIPTIRLFTSAVAVASLRGHRELTPSGYRLATRISDRFANGIVVNCEFLRQQLVDENVPQAKILLCYNGIDIPRFRRTDVHKPAALQAASMVIGTVCSLRREKDVPTLIDAFARVRDRLLGVMLVIVGSGPELDSWQQYADHRALRQVCHFEPATQDVSRWLSAMDIFVLPSRTEAFSNALMEAMASRCCVVASRVGGNPELIRHGETGLLFEPGDSESLAEQLAFLIQHPGQRRVLAESGERYIQSFSIDSAARNMEQIYCTLLSLNH